MASPGNQLLVARTSSPPVSIMKRDQMSVLGGHIQLWLLNDGILFCDSPAKFSQEEGRVPLHRYAPNKPFWSENLCRF